MGYDFNPNFAETYGVDEAVIIGMLIKLSDIRFKLPTHRVDFVNVDDKTYVGFDEMDFEELAPFWTTKKCFEILDRLVDKKVLVTKAGRKKFYAFGDEFLNSSKIKI
jgi:hypothetical protein